MINKKIDNLDQLRVQIAILKLHKAEQEIYFNQTGNNISKAFNSPVNFVKAALSFLGLRGGKANVQEADWATNLARLAFPFLLNKTLLSGSGFIFKGIVSFLSQNTINAKTFNKGILANWVDKIVDWVDSTNKKRKSKKEEIDYGISPESETYSGKPVH
jgi:hypothetical protein